MKRSLSLLLLALTACSQPPAASVQQPLASGRAATLLQKLHDPDGPVMIAAHRGCWKQGPENSLPAIVACIDLGVDIVEIDLRLTKDGEVVLHHDSSLRRMTGIDARVDQLSYQELAKLRLKPADGRTATAPTSEQIPTFREVLRHIDRKILLILDLKGPMPETAEKAAAILREMGNCDIAMFAWVAPADSVRAETGSLIECAEFLPNLRPEMGKPGSVIKTYAPLQPVAVAVRFSEWGYLAESAPATRQMGARLWVNTLEDYHSAGLTDANALRDPQALWGRLIANGVSMIQTDEPEALRAFIDSKNHAPD